MSFQQRFVSAPGTLEVGGRVLKRYHVNIDDQPIEPAIVRAAEAYLPRMVPAMTAADDATPRAGFCILHRGRAAAYLLAYSWVWDNVLECHTASAGEPFLGCPDRDPTNFVPLVKPWIGCVWELVVLEHERAAWVRHMFEAEVPALDTYLADTMPPGASGGSRSYGPAPVPMTR
jgi:hypothetical protein